MEIGGTLLRVGEVGVFAIDAGNGSMKTCFALGRAICAATGVEMCWMVLRANDAVLGACALGGVGSKGNTFSALCDRFKGKILLNLELSSKE